MKILMRLVGTLSGSAFQIHKDEDTNLLFDSLDKIQDSKTIYFDSYEFDKYESLYDSERAFNQYVLIDSKFDYHLKFFWEERDYDDECNNHTNNYSLKVPKHFFDEQLLEVIEFIQLDSL